MKLHDSHLSDQDLLLDLEGEGSSRQAKAVRAHLEGCWTCRTRRRELEDAIADFVRFKQEEDRLPAAEGPRALLKARLAQLSAMPESRVRSHATNGVMIALAASACVLLAVILFQVHSALAPGWRIAGGFDRLASGFEADPWRHLAGQSRAGVQPAESK